jgi:hypothetical protein
MAESQKDKKPAPAAEPEAPAKKKPPLKVIAVVGGLMVAEAAGVYLFVGMTGHGPQTAEAQVHGAEGHADDEAVEIELVDDKFQNLQTGRVWMWDIAIYLKAKKKHETYITEELVRRDAEIREGVGQIIRRAQHGNLREPDLTTLNRQLAAYFGTVFKPDAHGNSRIDRVLIPKCKGLQIDY